MANVKINWNGEQVRVEAGKMSESELKKLAFQIEGHAKQNIVLADQVDTGFLLNSSYVVVGTEVDTYFRARRSGTYHSTRSGSTVDRELAPREHPIGRAKGLVAFGAIYAIWQELRRSFLYKAAEQVAAEMSRND